MPAVRGPTPVPVVFGAPGIERPGPALGDPGSPPGKPPMPTPGRPSIPVPPKPPTGLVVVSSPAGTVEVPAVVVGAPRAFDGSWNPAGVVPEPWFGVVPSWGPDWLGFAAGCAVLADPCVPAPVPCPPSSPGPVAVPGPIEGPLLISGGLVYAGIPTPAGGKFGVYNACSACTA